MKVVMDSKIVVGKALKPHGIKGGLKVKPFTDDFSGFLSYDFFFFQKGSHFPEFTLKVKQIRPLNSLLVVYFENVTTIERAEELRSMFLSVDRDTVIKKKRLSENDVLVDDLIGYRVFDETEKYLGYVDAFYEGGVSGLYLVKDDRHKLCSSENGKESKYGNQDFFIPCDLNFYQEVDFEHQKIFLLSDSFLR